MQSYFKFLDNSKFQYCEFKDLQIGDIVTSTTYTYSQKYFYREGYEEFNMTKYGILIEKNNECQELSKILRYNYETNSFTVENLFANAGTSGSYYFKKYYE